MPIGHVAYGEEADPTHQNLLIDQVNENTEDIGDLESAVATLQGQVAAKPDLCDDNPEDGAIAPDPGDSSKASRCNHRHRTVGSSEPLAPAESADAGSEPLASREDHLHPGVSKIIPGTGIDVDPASGRGEVTITCTAAAGGLTKVEEPWDGSFSTGDVLATITPSAGQIPVAIYMEQTAGDLGALPTVFFGASEAGGTLYTNDNKQWGSLRGFVRWGADAGSGNWALAWTDGTTIYVKAAGDGSSTGKIIVYWGNVA